MAKKRKTLPKDFEEILKKGNIEEMKAVFDKCEINAYGGYGNATALAFDDCPHELAVWLIEQGLDIHTPDRYGNTPLHSRAGTNSGNIKSLLELGADVNRTDNYDGTPLHSAANGFRVENIKLLLAHGAKMGMKNDYENTPFEHALTTCMNTDIPEVVEISKVFLGVGVTITSKLKKLVSEIGKEFEFHRADFNKEDVNEYSNKLDELYHLFGVEPIRKRLIHDGKSLIATKEKTWQKQHQDFWEQLVPGSGPTTTMQGEVIRITGRVSNELDGNGGINWDADYKKMTNTFYHFIAQGKSLSEDEMKEASKIVMNMNRNGGETERMCELGVKWVLNNPEPIKLPALDYKR